MTVFRPNNEPDPTPSAYEQISKSATFARTPEGAKATFTGQDAGLSQSLADLRKGYANAATFQSDADREAALNRANVDAQIKANAPGLGVEFIGHRPEQYELGNPNLIPSSDPAWSEPLPKLREQLELAQELYVGPSSALNKLLETRSPEDAQHAVELEDRLRRSMGESSSALPPIEQPAHQARSETFPDGESVHVTQNPDGTLHVEYATGERFDGDPLWTFARSARHSGTAP